MLAASRRLGGSGRSGVERLVELTADRASGARSPVGSRRRSTTRPTAPGSAEARRVELTDDAFVLAVPNDFTREWIEGHFLELDPGRGARRDRRRASSTIVLDGVERRRGTAAGQRRPSRCARDGPSTATEPEVHLRLVRHRLVEPLRPRGRARRRRGAGAGLQPALHLRRHRARQDAPAPGDRAVRRRALRRR